MKLPKVVADTDNGWEGGTWSYQVWIGKDEYSSCLWFCPTQWLLGISWMEIGMVKYTTLHLLCVAIQFGIWDRSK